MEGLQLYRVLEYTEPKFGQSDAGKGRFEASQSVSGEEGVSRASVTHLRASSLHFRTSTHQ